MRFCKTQIYKTINFKNFTPGYEYGANLPANRDRCKRKYFTKRKGFLYIIVQKKSCTRQRDIFDSDFLIICKNHRV